MGDLIEALKKDPGSVSWGGGSAGGTDHIAVGQIAKAAGVDPTKINYIAFSAAAKRWRPFSARRFRPVFPVTASSKAR